jgi:YHS domain-containing protein
MRGAQRIALMVGVLTALSGVATAQNQIPWVGTWAEAQALAHRHHRLILVHFWSENCPPCWKMDRSVFNQPEVIRAMSTSYVPLKVNVSQDPDLVRQFGIDRWPTDVILTAAGQELYRDLSPLDTDRYIATLDQIAAHARVGMVSGGSPSTDLAVPRHGLPDSGSGSFPLGFADPSPSGSRSASPYGSQTGGPGGVMPPGGPEGRPAAPAPSSWTPGPPEQAASYMHRGGGAFPLPTPAPGSGMTTNPYIAQADIAQADPSREPPGTMPTRPSTEPSFPASTPFTPSARGSSLSPPSSSVPPLIGSSLSPPLTHSPNRPGVATAPLWPEREVSASAPPEPPVPALDGFCCVTLVEQEKWVKGDVRWGAVHRGQVYLFAGEEQQRRFLADFDRYAPVLSGYDPVQFVATGTLTAGKRNHGIFYRGQIYLFADEAALQQFWSAPERYVAAVRAEQYRQATLPAGPSGHGPTPGSTGIR